MILSDLAFDPDQTKQLDTKYDIITCQPFDAVCLLSPRHPSHSLQTVKLQTRSVSKNSLKILLVQKEFGFFQPILFLISLNAFQTSVNTSWTSAKHSSLQCSLSSLYMNEYQWKTCCE